MTDSKSNKNQSRDDYNPEVEVLDDAVVGSAFKWSMLVIIIAGVSLAVWKFWPSTINTTEDIIEKDPGDIPELVIAGENIPTVTFTNITKEAGINFVHENGAVGDKFLPETMGGGSAFLDYDNDGNQDLLFVNSNHWPDAQTNTESPTLALYANDGKGNFTDVTSEVGLDVSIYGMGCATGDYDNDGNVDIFISALGSNRLFHNTGGSFHEVTEQANVAGSETQWSSSAGFLDYNRDGFLDLFVCNYVKWSREIDFELNFTLNGTDRAYGPPTNYSGAHSYLYLNNGDGTFSDTSEEAGLHIMNAATNVPVGKALAVAFVDLDRDGWPDIVVANDTVGNFVFHNKQDGTFEEIGAASGIAYDSMGSATGAMGIDAAYYRNDDAIAIGMANFAKEMTSFYVSQRDPMLFSDQAIVEGIGSPSRQKLSFGLFFFDYDLDGRLDLLQANGHLEEEINEIESSQFYQQSAQLFWNCGHESRSCFSIVPDEITGDLSTKIVGRGASYADIDNDGDLDILLTQTGSTPLLLRNDQNLNHHWIRFKLTGTKSNRDAIGAIIEVKVGETISRQQVMPARSYLSQVELPVTFGLGNKNTVDEVRIIWPSGATQFFPNLKVDQLHIVEESENRSDS